MAESVGGARGDAPGDAPGEAQQESSGGPAGPGEAEQAVAGASTVAASSHDTEPSWVNFPNAFTFLRVVLVPLVLWLLTVDTTTARWWAFGVFVFAAWTDSLDGWVARRFGRVTRWGQLADPLADKLLVLGTLASLALVGEVPWWAVAVILAREVWVTWLRLRLVRRLRRVMPASIWGKLKTVTQIVAVSAYLAPIVPDSLADALLWFAVAATIGSGIAYAIDVRREDGGTDAA